MISLRTCLIPILLLGLVGSAVAQWAWRDAAGRMVYSDRPPPADIKPEQIVTRPPAVAPAPAKSPPPVATPAAPAPATPAPTKAKSAAEMEMEFRQRQQEREAAAKKADEQRAKAEARAAECERARGYLTVLERGERVVRLNAQGEREDYTDAQREAEIKRLRQQIAAGCN
ncbi:MAG: DUF4124 domain-containing protein [Betaproteobacteria bacterium]